MADSHRCNHSSQAKFQEHKRVSQMYKLELEEEKRAAASSVEAPVKPLGN